jgi:O-antigen/teichoic acid export membrane protein
MVIQKSSNVKNSGWNLVNTLLYPTIFLGLTPFFIDQLGETLFGQWMLLNSYVLISVQIISFGLPVAITAHVAEAVGAKDLNKLYAYINSSAKLLGRISLAVTVLAGIILILPHSEFSFFGEYTWITFALSTFSIAVKLQENLGQSILKGYERYDRASYYNMGNRIGALILQIAAVAYGYSLLSIISVTLIVNLVMVATQWRSITKELPDYHFNVFKTYPEQKDLTHFGFWNWLQIIIAAAAFQLDRFIIAGYLGTATLTYYTLAANIANQLHLAFESLVGSVLPKFAKLKATDSDTKDHFITARTFSVGTSILGLAGLYLISEPVFTLWLGEIKYLKLKPFFDLFIIFELLIILTIIPKTYLNAVKALTLATGLELFYKAAMIIGMVGGFFLFGSVESLIQGQIIALVVSIPIFLHVVNQSVLRNPAWQEVVLGILPSILISIGIAFHSREIMAVSIIGAIIMFWIFYMRDPAFKTKLLVE